MAATISEPFVPPAPAPAAAALPGTEAASPAGEATKSDWRFVEPQPIREDQVENAVKFLAHPKVKGSPIVYRRSFLERKGLTKEEIDEAFRRVPDPPSDSSSGSLPATAIQPAPVTIPQPVAQPPGALMHPGMGHYGVVQPPKSTSWAQLILAVGGLTAAGAGAGVLTKRFLVPKFKIWIRQVVLGESEPTQPSKASPVQEATAQAAAAAAAAATAATQMAGAMQEIAHSRSEERQRLDNIIKAVEAQTQELKNALAGMKDVALSSEVTKYQRPVEIINQANGVDSWDAWKGQTSGSRPSSGVVVESNGFPKPPRSEAISVQHTSSQQVRSMTTSPAGAPTHAPHSQSYMDVIAMLERGEKPPGIREVNDKPPNPNQPPSNPRLQPRQKPWEKSSTETRPISPNISSTPIFNNEPERPQTESYPPQWWRKKEPEPEPSVKITEVDASTETDQPRSSLSPQNASRSGWVPPSVPQPIYPGAHEAIRRPKSAAGSSSSSLPSTVESGSAPVEPPTVSAPAQSQAEDGGSSSQQSTAQTEQPQQIVVDPPAAATGPVSDASPTVESDRSFKEVVQAERDEEPAADITER